MVAAIEPSGAGGLGVMAMAVAAPQRAGAIVDAAKIRNVALVGHNGAGKTSLAEALLHRSGAVNRLGRVEQGTTVCDHDPEEQRRLMSLGLAIAPFDWHGHRVNLVDTPGYADFTGDVAAAFRVVDLAVFVVSAVDGVQAQTEAIWKMASSAGIPRLVFVNKLDLDRADFERTLAELQARFGAGIAPLELPIGGAQDFRGIADLLTDTAHLYVDGAPQQATIPDDMEEMEQRVHDALVEGIVVGDDQLLERYLDGDIPSVEELERTLARGVAEATVFPVVCGSAIAEIAIDRLADFLCEIAPAPLDRPTPIQAGDVEVDVHADAAGDPLVFVFKTIADPYVGQVSVFKVLSGTIGADAHLVNTRTGADERLHGMFLLRGKEHVPVTAVGAGDIAAVAKLSATVTGDTLAPKGKPVRLAPIERPQPALAVAIVPRTQADDDKLSSVLQRLQQEDPVLVVERDDETQQTLLRGTGDTHLAVALERMTRKFNVNVDLEDVRVRYRETATGEATAIGKHKKQSGGHGQFAICEIRLEPLPRGSGFEFVDRIVGGAIPRQFVGAVQKGLEETMASGGTFGYPIVDIRVTLFDGKFHSVDSSEAAFKAAARLALRAAMADAGPVLLEPVSSVQVVVPLDRQGDVLADLAARRGRVQDTVAAGSGEHEVHAVVPTSELIRYAVDLRSLTGGRGHFVATHSHYDVAPAHIAEAARRSLRDD
jgi:elongation factor G